MKILFKFATRSRPEKFLKGIENINKHISISMGSEIVVSYDKDDQTMNDQVFNRAKESEIDLYLYSGWSKNKVYAINRDVEKHRDWDILVNFSDDMEFIVPGFDGIIRKDMMENFPDTDGVLHYPDGNHYHDKLMTMSIIGRKYYERDGYIYHPDYISVWCDNEAMEVAKMRGKYKFIDHHLFNHNHPAWGKAQFDEQYRITESYYHIDEQTYNRRKQNGFK